MKRKFWFYLKVRLAFAVLFTFGSGLALADTLTFEGQLDVIVADAGGGVYSGTPIGTHFSGVINDVTEFGKISNGTTQINFSCCIAAGGIEVSDNFVLDADTAALLNSLAGTTLFNAGDLIDNVNIEGDALISGTGRIEVGLSFIFAPDTFSVADPDSYPFDPNDVLISVFFITEEQDYAGPEIILYDAVGKLTSTLISSRSHTGHWLNHDESGWGINLTQQADTMTYSIFTHDINMNAIWYVGSCKVSVDTCSGSLYHVTGVSALTMPFDNSNKQTTSVGTINIIFTSRDTAIMNYVIDGASDSKNIERFVFDDPEN
jgi:hypothetical protein